MKALGLQALTIAFLLLILPHAAPAAPGATPTCCYCEIGDEPRNQQALFRAGCAVWLRKQKGCSVKATVAQNTDYSALDLSCKGGQLKVGFVGHWSSSRETIDYLKRRIVPALQTHDLSISFDNTACSGMNHPEDVRAYVESLSIPKSGPKALEVRGHQVDSVGEWDLVLGKSVSFRAIVSSRQAEVVYPACNTIERRSCVPVLQTGQSGSCRQADGQLERLTCCVPRWPGLTVLNPLIHQSWNSRSACLY